jgi:hypothetical protein
MNDAILINEEASFRQTQRIASDVTRNLVTLALAEARTRLLRRTGEGEETWRSRFPEEPFDMKFFVGVLESVFGQLDIVKAVIEGKGLPEAAGWE